ncbi:MAG: hypothetical protein ACFFCW_29210 [Candidatus Hodarchaeota archaeon]
MTIRDVAQKINELASNYEMGDFQLLRKQLKNLSRVGSYHLFAGNSIFEEGAYAFHWGGRKEIQYNIEYEKDSKLFRYGLAFSLESSPSLHDPVTTLKPKIMRFNEYLTENREKFSDMYFWFYRSGERSKNFRPRVIDDALIRKDNFIFVGKFFRKTIDQLTLKDYEKILATFDNLLEVYKYVEGESTLVPGPSEKIARICWNDQNWQRPSGREGKSKDKSSFECRAGYGHEEWLFDTGKLIDGYHYSFLQQIGNNIDKYQGNIFDISFYTINSDTRERWWVGGIKNVVVISQRESDKAYAEYRKRGWLKEMKEQLKNVGADVSHFVKFDNFFNIKYKIEDLELLDSPLRFSSNDAAVRGTYYSTLLNKVSEPVLESPLNGQINYKPGYSEGKESKTVSYGQRESEIDLFHNRMQGAIHKQLEKSYGRENVGKNIDTGFGSFIDLVVKDKDSFVFYELKTSNSIKNCIREALPQLMEYAFWPNQNRAKKLIIVSQNPITKRAQEYLSKLRKEFSLPIFYQRYNSESRVLEEQEY